MDSTNTVFGLKTCSVCFYNLPPQKFFFHYFIPAHFSHEGFKTVNVFKLIFFVVVINSYILSIITRDFCIPSVLKHKTIYIYGMEIGHIKHKTIYIYRMEIGHIQISMYTNQIFARKAVEWLHAEKRAAFTNNNVL